MIVAELPKTRSGKIMRRLLRDVADHRELGDVTTLTDSSVMDLIGEKMPTRRPRTDRSAAARSASAIASNGARTFTSLSK